MQRSFRPKNSASLALAALLAIGTAGCCLPASCGPDGCGATGCSPACGMANGRAAPLLHHFAHHGRLVPEMPPGECVPRPKFHPLPTHPIFEPQPDYPPVAPLHAGSSFEGASPSWSEPQPTPAALPYANAAIAN